MTLFSLFINKIYILSGEDPYILIEEDPLLLIGEDPQSFPEEDQVLSMGGKLEK